MAAASASRWKIVGVVHDPVYQYNPRLFWDALPDAKKAMLPPGPNGPVGVVWINLSKPHYGIHGTPHPELIGRSESHGCIRLTNWDAARLAHGVPDWRDADLCFCGRPGFGQALKRAWPRWGCRPRAVTRNCSRCGDRERRAPPGARDAQNGRPT